MKQITAEEFLRDVAAHTMTIKQDAGIYRHLSFRGPALNSWNLWFDIITWPQVLVINGDMGSWMFARVPDMFGFFRSSRALEINTGYWSEKILSESRFGGPHEKFVPEVYQANVIDSLNGYGLEDGFKAEVIEALTEAFQETEGFEGELRAAVRKFRHREFEFSDPWEIDGNACTIHYLWCCYAIVWAIQQYDAAKATASPQSESAATR